MIGHTLAHFEIFEKIGEGGMGIVYKARDTHRDRLVAIKILPPAR
jgi:serine/threonine protein kinase